MLHTSHLSSPYVLNVSPLCSTKGKYLTNFRSVKCLFVIVCGLLKMIKVTIFQYCIYIFQPTVFLLLKHVIITFQCLLQQRTNFRIFTNAQPILNHVQYYIYVKGVSTKIDICGNVVMVTTSLYSGVTKRKEIMKG